jgi:branched-subunit amino acid transport protein
VSWPLLIALGAVSYGLKAVGPIVIGGRELHARVRLVLELVAVPLLAALVVVQTLSVRQQLALDARVPAVAVAALLVGRRAPFLVVVVAAAATAALLRALG